MLVRCRTEDTSTHFPETQAMNSNDQSLNYLFLNLTDYTLFFQHKLAMKETFSKKCG
jgi:hypothetical protein